MDNNQKSIDIIFASLERMARKPIRQGETKVNSAIIGIYVDGKKLSIHIGRDRSIVEEFEKAMKMIEKTYTESYVDVHLHIIDGGSKHIANKVNTMPMQTSNVWEVVSNNKKLYAKLLDEATSDYLKEHMTSEIDLPKKQ